LLSAYIFSKISLRKKATFSGLSFNQYSIFEVHYSIFSIIKVLILPHPPNNTSGKKPPQWNTALHSIGQARNAKKKKFEKIKQKIIG